MILFGTTLLAEASDVEYVVASHASYEGRLKLVGDDDLHTFATWPDAEKASPLECMESEVITPLTKSYGDDMFRVSHLRDTCTYYIPLCKIRRARICRDYGERYAVMGIINAPQILEVLLYSGTVIKPIAGHTYEGFEARATLILRQLHDAMTL